jgi:hypothetical protein
MKGILVFYVDVGALSPSKAEAFVDRMKDNLNNSLDRIKNEGYEILFIPIRPNSQTRVEIIPLEDRLQKLEDAKLQLLATNPNLLI